MRMGLGEDYTCMGPREDYTHMRKDGPRRHIHGPERRLQCHRLRE